MKAVRNTNVIFKPGMYRIASSTTQTRAPQLNQTFRNTNPRASTSTGIAHKTNVSRPPPRSNQMKDKGSAITRVMRLKRLIDCNNSSYSLLTLVATKAYDGACAILLANSWARLRFGNDQFAPILGYGDLIQETSRSKGFFTNRRVFVSDLQGRKRTYLTVASLEACQGSLSHIDAPQVFVQFTDGPQGLRLNLRKAIYGFETSSESLLFQMPTMRGLCLDTRKSTFWRNRVYSSLGVKLSQLDVKGSRIVLHMSSQERLNTWRYLQSCAHDSNVDADISFIDYGFNYNKIQLYCDSQYSHSNFMPNTVQHHRTNATFPTTIVELYDSLFRVSALWKFPGIENKQSMGTVFLLYKRSYGNRRIHKIGDGDAYPAEVGISLHLLMLKSTKTSICFQDFQRILKRSD
ncbi:hypothetical protein Tco_0710860 [Tanacetum coccineum]